MERSVTGAPGRRRTPEAFGKDGSPAQHTAASTAKCRPCLAPLAATLQATDGLSSASSRLIVPDDVAWLARVAAGADVRAFDVRAEHIHKIGPRRRALRIFRVRVYRGTHKN